MQDPESERDRGSTATVTALPPRGARRIPCRRCGYHAPGPDPCPHCDDSPQEPSLSGPLPGALGELVAGATALPRGIAFLARDPRSIAILAVPVLLALAAFAGVTVWAVRAVDAALRSGPDGGVELDPAVPDWLAPSLTWLLELGLFQLAAEAAAVTATLLVAALCFWFAFSLVFEGLAGPFLDEVHARFETRWFGADPRSRLERPAGATPTTVARLSWMAAALGLAAAIIAWRSTDGLVAVAASLAAAGAPAVALGLAHRPFGRWLAWVVSIELSALRASLSALVLTGAILVLALPLLAIPLLGTYLYGAAAGFATALGLLDIPFGRRGLGLDARVRFLRQHPLATALHGVLSGLLFGIPFLGPLVVVPAASVGGLWLFCRLDKRGLRAAGSPAPPGP